MKYISLDIETTGLNPDTCQILEVGAILEDTAKKRVRNQCPSFHAILDHQIISGEPYALQLNQKLLNVISTKSLPFTKPKELACDFSEWLLSNGITKPITVAGKNAVKLDIPFLDRLPGFNAWSKFHHRVLDPSSLFVNFDADEYLPSSESCKSRAGISGPVVHTALDDAWDVIQILRTRY